ncbi:MAG: CHAT domain-containing protein [Prevotella sp.]|nr:CHAT domain-containing protein [Prevotella sp.]
MRKYITTLIICLLWIAAAHSQDMPTDSISRGTETETDSTELTMEDLYKRGQYHEVIKLYEENADSIALMSISQDTAEVDLACYIHNLAANAYSFLGYQREALMALNQKLTTIRPSNDPNDTKLACTLTDFAKSWYLLYEDEHDPKYLEWADTAFHQAQKEWEKTPEFETQIAYPSHLYEYSKLMAAKGNYEEAKDSVLKAAIIYQKQLRQNSYIKALIRKADYEAQCGNFAEATSIYMSIMIDSTYMTDTEMIATTSYHVGENLGIRYGNAEDAETFLLPAYVLLDNYGDNVKLKAEIAKKLSTLYRNISLYDEALKYIELSIALKQENGFYVPLSYFLDGMEIALMKDAAQYAAMADDDETLVTVESTLKGYLSKHQDERVSVFRINTILSELYMLRHRYEEADKALQNALTIAKDVWGTESHNYQTALHNRGVNYELWGKQTEAFNTYKECAEVCPSLEVYNNLLWCAASLNDITLTEECLRKSYKYENDFIKSQFLYLSNEQRERLITEKDRGEVASLTLPAAMFPNSGVCCEYAYNSALVSKGLLLGTGRKIAEAIMESGDSTLIANQNVLRMMQQQLQTCNDSARIVSLNRDIATLEKEISESLQAYADFTRDIDLTWRDVQQRLTDNETAVEFVIIDPRALTHPTDTTVYYGAMLLNKNFEAPKFVPLSAKNATDDIIRQLSYEAGRGEAADEANITSLSRSLNDFIWQPITTCITPGNRVSFAPVSMLSIAPLEYLTDSTDTPICDRYDMRRLSSTRELCKDRSTKPGDNAVLYGGLIYDNGSTTDSISTTRSKRAGWRYLPHTAEEVDSITLILKGAGYYVTTHKGMDGSEEVFRSMSGKDIDILHVATHGFYFNEDESATLDFFKDLNIPVRRNMSISNLMRSGLLLSGGQQAWLGGKADATDGNDGVALSSEISLLDLHNVSLVTLSACQTGQGDISADGVVGLQRGFKMAGAESILMTLWDVNDDATRLFMTSFYRHLAAGKDKHEALRQAQTDLRHYDNGRYDAPRYWAAFILLE